MLVLLGLILLPGKEEAEQTLVSLSETRDDLLRKRSNNYFFEGSWHLAPSSAAYHPLQN